MTSSPGWVANGAYQPLSPGWRDVRQDYDARVYKASFGGVSFESGGLIHHPGGVMYTIRRLTGWWDPAPDETQTLGHPSGDGVVEFHQRLGARVVQVDGLILAGDREMPLLRGAQRDLARLRSGVFRVDERDGVVTECDVRAVALEFQQYVPWVARYSLTLRASDPLRYTSASKALTNGANALVNLGDVDAHPVITLTGPHAALTITHPGGTFGFPALASGTRVIDCRNGDVWNGNTRVFPTVSGAWPVVRSGGSNWTVSGLGAGTARVNRVGAYS